MTHEHGTPGAAPSDAAAHAQHLIDDYFAALRAEPHHESLPAVQAWLHRVEERQRDGTPARRRRVGTWVRLHPYALAAAACVVLLLGAACLPVTDVRAVGFVLDGHIALPPTEATRVLRGVPGVEPGHVSALGEVTTVDRQGRRRVAAYVGSGVAVVDGQRVITPTSKFAVVVPHAGEVAARALAEQLRALRAVDSVRVRAITDTVRTRAYRVALASMKLQFDAPTDEATLRRHIAEHLAGLEMRGVSVRSVAAPGGGRRIELTVENADLSPEDERRLQAFLRSVQPAAPPGRR
jgi:hypothetical protein